MIISGALYLGAVQLAKRPKPSMANPHSASETEIESEGKAIKPLLHFGHKKQKRAGGMRWKRLES
jgi:hypothetical protein